MNKLVIGGLIVAAIVITILYINKQSAAPVSGPASIMPPAVMAPPTTVSTPVLTPISIMPPASSTPGLLAMPLSTQSKPSWKCTSTNGSWGIMSRSPTNMVECATPDGVNCWWYNDANSCNAQLNNLPATTKPLICGDMVKQIWGVDGTNDPTNWCYTYRTDV